MKYLKSIITAAALTVGISCQAQIFALELHHSDGRTEAIKLSDIEEVSFGTLTEGVDYVDLGLPSGTLWALQDLGYNESLLDSPLFVFGHTSPWAMNYNDHRTTFTFSPARDKTIEECIAGGIVDENHNLTADFDAATIWGGAAWRIPTAAQWTELLEECEWSLVHDDYETYNYTRVTGPNGKSLLFRTPHKMTYSIVNNKPTFSWDLRGNYTSATLGDDGNHIGILEFTYATPNLETVPSDYRFSYTTAQMALQIRPVLNIKTVVVE